MPDRTLTSFDDPWDTLRVVKRGRYHLYRPERGLMTLCGIDFRGGIDPVMSLPLPRDNACDDCMAKLPDVIFGAA